MIRCNAIPTSPGDSATDMEKSAARSLQLGFLARLPSDITLEIFSYMRKQDCLTCMAVCRDWYLCIPQYTQNCWKTLRLKTQDAYAENQCFIRFLGDHVESVILEKFAKDESLYNMIHKLLNWGCTKIKSLELKECLNDNQDTFLKALAKLAPHLTILKLVKHGSNISFLHVLQVCSRLTRFTYLARPGDDLRLIGVPGVYDTEPVVHAVESPIGVFPSIEHLHLDVCLHRQLRLNPILQRCPNLRSFVGASTVAGHDSNTLLCSVTIDFNLLLDWCPKISYVLDTLSYNDLSDLDDSSFYTSSEFSGLRYLGASNTYERASIIRLLTKNQHTLEHLSIRTLYTDDKNIRWISLLKSFQLTQLRTLALYGLQFDLTSILAICKQCPILERLDLKKAGFTYDQSQTRSLYPMNQIRQLTLENISFHNGLSLPIVLEQFSSLETICLDDLILPINFPDNHKCPKQLKKVSLLDVTWSPSNDSVDENDGPTCLLNWIAVQSKLEEVVVLNTSNFGTWSLSALVSIPTLKNVNIWLDNLRCGPTEENDLNNFATSLKETAVEELRIETLWHLPDETVCKLKELPQLSSFESYHIWEGYYCERCSK